MSHVFISYKHDDGHFVDSLREKLKAAEIDSWVDTDIEAGEDWKEKIDTAIEAAFAVVVVLTPESHLSPYVTYEWSYAMGLGKQIVPVILRKTDRHPKLEAKQYIDFTERQWPEKALVERLHILKKSYSPSLYSQRSKNAGWEYQHVKDVIDDLNNDDQDIRSAAVITLGELRVVEAIEPLIRCLKDPNIEVRMTAIRSLGQIKTEKAIPALMSLANRQSLDDELKQEAFIALARIGGKNAMRFLKQKYLDFWAHEQDWDSAVTMAVLESVNLYGRTTITKDISESLSDYVDTTLETHKYEIAQYMEQLKTIHSTAGKEIVKEVNLKIEIEVYVPFILKALTFLERPADYLGLSEKWLNVRFSLHDLEDYAFPSIRK